MVHQEGLLVPVEDGGARSWLAQRRDCSERTSVEDLRVLAVREVDLPVIGRERAS